LRLQKTSWDFCEIKDIEQFLSKDDDIVDCLLGIVRKMVTHKIIAVYPLICENLKSKNDDLYAKLEKIMKYDMTDKVQELILCLDFLNITEISIKMTLYEMQEYIYLKNEFQNPKDTTKNDKPDETLLKKRTIKEFEETFKKVTCNENKTNCNESTIIEGKSEQICNSEKYKNRKVIDMSEYLHTYDPILTDFANFKYKRMVNFSFITLDQNFYDFFQNNLYKKCELCHKYPWGETMAVCLICGF